MAQSKDGKGRTLWEILTGRNKRDLTPLELQYHNPLGAKVGCTVSIDHDPQTAGVNFVIERLGVYETKIKEKKFYHTDYFLKGVTLDRDTPIKLRLRLVPDEDVNNKLGCRILLLNNYEEMEWDEGFYNGVLLSESGVFDVNYDDEGKELQEPRRYWRIEDVLDPYKARVTLMADSDGNGKIDDNELERVDVTYWDYHRNTEDQNGVEYTEYLIVEMKDKSRYFTFLRGREVGSFQVSVI